MDDDIAGRIALMEASGLKKGRVTLVEITPFDVKVEFLRISYDVEKMVRAIAAGELPTYFAEKLKEAR